MDQKGSFFMEHVIPRRREEAHRGAVGSWFDAAATCARGFRLSVDRFNQMGEDDYLVTKPKRRSSLNWGHGENSHS
jgi:hypothetical protein